MPYSILIKPKRSARSGVGVAAAAALLFAGAGAGTAQAEPAAAQPVSPAHCALLPGQAAVGAVENGHLMRVFTPITLICDSARGGDNVTVQYKLFLHDRWQREGIPEPIVDRMFATGSSTVVLPLGPQIDPEAHAVGVSRTVHLDNEFDAPNRQSVFLAAVRYRVEAPGVDESWSAWQTGWYAGVTE